MLEKFPIDPGKSLQFSFAKQNRDDRAFRTWRRSARLTSKPKFLDALELTTIAFRRWKDADVKGRVANDLGEIKDLIQDNPHAEVAVLILVRAHWLRRRPVVGLCHFRRTWCNNIFIDYLTRHPSLFQRHREKPVQGVGTSLLYFVASVAREIGAKRIWGEATQNSAQFYKHVFEKTEITDLIFLSKKDYNGFLTRYRPETDDNVVRK